MHVRVQKWGNSLAVRIPNPLAKDAEVREGRGDSRGPKKVIPQRAFGQGE
jgi:Antidote-toxin recognition MazE, bacterial antitoxin